jgi:hypothetical protein
MIVAAGNRVEDGAIAYDMGTALSDRLVHLHMVAEASDWIENYAVPKGLHPAVTAFLRGRPDLLDTTDEALRQGHVIACTPRAWERTSQIMQSVPGRTMRAPMIAGTLGVGVAAEFAIVADDIAASVHVQEMLEADPKGRLALYPQSLNGLNALVFGLVGAANAKTMPGGDVQYWSVSTVASFTNGSLWDGVFDMQVPVDKDGYYTIVVSLPEDRPQNATDRDGVAWVNWGPGEGIGDPRNRKDWGALLMRFMVPSKDWQQSPLKHGELATVMGPYYPKGYYTTREEFEKNGVRK